jgi:hypothetical protein
MPTRRRPAPAARTGSLSEYAVLVCPSCQGLGKHVYTGAVHACPTCAGARAVRVAVASLPELTPVRLETKKEVTS